MRVTPSTDFSAVGDVTIGTLPDNIPTPAINPVIGPAIDVTSGTNFGVMRIYQNRTVTMNFNNNNNLKGHFIEATVMYQY